MGCSLAPSAKLNVEEDSVRPYDEYGDEEEIERDFKQR